MGTVYEAEEISSGERVAVKVHRLSSKGQAGGLMGDHAGWKSHELFERSSRVLGDLNHRGLPKVHAFLQDDRGRSILVRERFEGETLQERITREHRRADGDQIRQLLRGLLELLVYLHGRIPPVVHRDIKPRNIMFRSPTSWDPVLVDFDSVVSPRQTGQGESAGRGETIIATPGYAAPEQLAGDSSPPVDLHAVGATLLFVITHREPDELERRHGRIANESLLANVDAGVRRCVLKLAEPDRFRRYPSAVEALRDLDGAVAPTSKQRSGVPLRHMQFGIFAATIVLGVSVAYLSFPTPPPTTNREGHPLVEPVSPTVSPTVTAAPVEPASAEPTVAPPPKEEPPRTAPAKRRVRRAATGGGGGGLEEKLARLSPHIEKITFAYGGVRVPRVQLRATTNDGEALTAAVRVVRELLKQDPEPATLIGQRSAYAVAYVDLPPAAVGERQTTKPFALRGLKIAGTVVEDRGARRVFGPPFRLMSDVVYERNGVALCCRVEQIGEVRGREILLH